MGVDGGALLGAGFDGLFGQGVLQLRHADVHGQGRVRQAVLFGGGAIEAGRHQPAQGPAQQRVRAAVADAGAGGQLQQPVQAGVGVDLQQLSGLRLQRLHAGAKVALRVRLQQQLRQIALEVGPALRPLAHERVGGVGRGGKVHGWQAGGFNRENC